MRVLLGEERAGEVSIGVSAGLQAALPESGCSEGSFPVLGQRCPWPLGFGDREQGSARQGLCRVDGMRAWLWSQPPGRSASLPFSNWGPQAGYGFDSFVKQRAITEGLHSLSESSGTEIHTASPSLGFGPAGEVEMKDNRRGRV